MTSTHRRDERGSAMIITILVMTVVMVLGTTIFAVAINNLGSARRSQDAAGALDAADSGITQAISHLRRNGGRALACSPTCTGNAYGSRTAPVAVELPGATDQRYQVWVEPLPTGAAPSFYRIHSRGFSNEGVRDVQVDVELTLLATKLPLGVFARTVSGGGNADLERESIYTTGCVYNRSHIGITGTDVATGLPAAVHSSRIITDANGNNTNCSADKKAIHDGGTACAPSAPFDHDSLGGPLATGSPCLAGLTTQQRQTYYSSRDLDGNGTVDVNGSYLRDDAALKSLFSIDDDPLKAPQLEQLKAIARQQGTYFTRASPFTQARPDNPHAVMYFDLSATDPGGVVDLKDITTHRRSDLSALSATDPRCRNESLLIVIDGGNARFNGNPTLAASVVLTSRAPYGEIIKANGTAGLVGTVFADKVNLVGTLDLALDACFISNLAPSLYTVSVSNYLEVDR